MRIGFLSLVGAALLLSTAASARDFRIGIQDDPDVLDPHRSRTFVGEVVFASLCDSLVAIGPDLVVQPKLATAWSWSDGDTRLTLTLTLRPGVTFHDGSPLTAAVAKANLDRARTLPDSMRKSELQSVKSVDVVDDMTIAITLDHPDPTLLPQLSNRAGMMLSPAAFAPGQEVSQNPICSGPYKFVEREQNNRIVLEKFAGYRDAADYHFDRVIFLTIPDTTIRLANLQSGDLDMLERLAPSDVPAVEADPALQLAKVTSVGYQGLTINVGKGKGADGPLGRDKRVRQALQLAIDRDVINQVVGADTFEPTRQPFAPGSPYRRADLPVAGRDVAKARQLLTEAGYDRVAFDLAFATSTTIQQVAELIQSMAAEAGFDITLRPVEFASMLNQAQAGDYQVVQLGWSGRYDPDGNLYQFITCGAGLNYSGFCSAAIDKLMNDARSTNDPAARKALYDKVQDTLQDELPMIYLYHQPWLYALAKTVKGFVPTPDGLIRLKGVSIEGS